MRQAGKTRLVIALKRCVDAAGVPMYAGVIKSSGYPAYDTRVDRIVTGCATSRS